MQLIYTFETTEEARNIDPVKTLQKQLDQSRELFVFLLYFLTEVARYAETNAKLRASRNLVTTEDLNVNIKIAGNELLWKILEDESFKMAVAIDKPHLKVDPDLVRKVFMNLVASDVYQEYIRVQSRDKNNEKNILKFIFTDLMLPNEHFTDLLEEHFTNWDDDGEMVDQVMLNYLQKPGAYNLRNMLAEEKWNFGKTLLKTMLDKKDYVTEIIKPKLQNWDADRIALLDMILMQMGVCELLYFETIPLKVTINEYIDIAKDYSTEQSGQFINGILDGIHKDLVAQNKIHKIDFKQKAN